ncbi:MAG: translocation/assembly module TamB domain-containing protein [Casimicrobiaceae bacterium]
MARAAGSSPPRRRRVWPWVLGALLVLVVLALAGGFAWLRSEAGLKYAVDQIVSRSNGEIEITNPRGSLLSTIEADALKYRTKDTEVTARDVKLSWSPSALIDREVQVDELTATELDVTLKGGNDEKPKLPDSLSLPLPVRVDRVSLGMLRIKSGDAEWPIRNIGFGYRGGPDGHRFTNIGLNAEAGTLSGALEIGAKPPFKVAGDFTLEGTPALKSPRLQVTASGSLERLQLQGRGTVAGASVDASAALTPTGDVPLQTVDVTIKDLDLRAIDKALPTTKLAVELHGKPADDAILAGSFEARNTAAGLIDRERVPVVRLASDFVLKKNAIVARDIVAELAGGGTVRGSGTIALAADIPGDAGSSWSLKVRDVDLAALHSKLVKTQLAGSIDATLQDKVQEITASITEQGMSLDAKAKIAGTTLDLQRFALKARGGELAGKAEFDWSGKQRFAIDAKATHFDPSRFGDFPSASLDATIDAKGQLQPAISVQGTLALAPTSRYAGSPVAGRVAGDFTRERIDKLNADLRVAGATVHAEGSLGQRNDRLRFALDAPRLDALLALVPGKKPEPLAGSLQASGTVTGAYDGLGIELTAKGQALRVPNATIGRLDVTASVAPGAGYSLPALRSRPIKLDVRAGDVKAQGRNLERLAATIAGSLAEHTLTASAKGGDIDLDLAAQGGLASATSWSPEALAWNGSITRLESRGTYALRLTKPAPFAASAQRIRLAEAPIALEGGQVRIGSFEWNQGRVTTSGDFTGLPVTSLARISGANLPVRTTLVLGGDWNVAAMPRLNGTVRVRRERGDVFADTKDVLDTAEMPFGITELGLEAKFVDDVIDASVRLDSTRLGSLSGKVNIGRAPDAEPGRITAKAPLRGSVTAELGSLQVLQPFLGTTAIVDGTLRADVALTGTVGSPEASGSVTAGKVRIDAPQYGLHWHDGVLRAHTDGKLITIDDFSIAAGDGRFRVTGTVPIAALTKREGAAPAQLTWTADKFQATNRPDLRLVTSGEGTVGFSQGKVALRGALRVDQGRVEFEQRKAGKLGDDVVVVGREKMGGQKKTDNLPLDLDLRVDLGSRLYVQGGGLRTTLRGQIRLTTGPGGTLLANGTIRTVDGIYEAFGQQLTIDRGQLTFDGPIDNPTLDIVALRKNLPVEAGVELTGTARLPRVRLTSDPPVPDGEKLSWLVLGQGLERTSGADLAALQAAAGALFGSTGPSLGTRVAKRIGLDDLAIRSSSAGGAPGVQNQVLAFSKRLTDRLYLVFEAGLNVANNALKLEYALSKSFTLRATAGTVSSLGIYFMRSYP